MVRDLKKIDFIVIGVLASLLLSSVFIPSVASAGNKEKVVIPSEWNGKYKIVIPHGDLVEVIYLRYADNPTPVKKGPADDGLWGDTSYHNGYDVSGYHWKSRGVSYVVNPSLVTMQNGLQQDDVIMAIQNSFAAWNSLVPMLYTYGGVNDGAQASLYAPDYVNLITWASINDSDNNIIAMSIMWYRTSNLALLDCDIVFNTHYPWGIDADGEEGNTLTGAFDVRDICTHEAGHWTGLNDLYDRLYTPMTMYGYASFGETYKISLEPGDIHGVQHVYRGWSSSHAKTV
jgi:Matrixin